jgi:hypothetical protein
VVVAVKEPEVPVTTTSLMPTVGGAELLAVNVITLVPVVTLGLMDAVTPLGRLEAARVTGLWNPT